MSDEHPNKGPQDIGGEEAGPVDTIDHGMKFWERQANGLRSVLQRNKVLRTDELRRAAEDLGPKYGQLEYFEITTSALRTVLLEKGLITEQELGKKMEEVRARFDVPDEMESPLKKAAPAPESRQQSGAVAAPKKDAPASASGEPADPVASGKQGLPR